MTSVKLINHSSSTADWNYFIPVRKFFTDVGFRLQPHIVFSGIPAAAFFHRQNPGL